MIVLDTDILSCFSKIKRFDLLQSLFKKEEFCIPLRVYEELLRAKEKGYDFVDYALKLIEEGKIRVEPLDRKELDVVRELSKRGRLGFGEIEALALAKVRGGILLSNDRVVGKVGAELNVDVFNLEDILHAFLKFNIITKGELENLINEIESKDRIKIKNKDKLLK